MRFWIIHFFFGFAIAAPAQNLVPNGSFEDTVGSYLYFWERFTHFDSIGAVHYLEGSNSIQVPAVCPLTQAKGWFCHGRIDYYNLLIENEGNPRFDNSPEKISPRTGNGVAGVQLYDFLHKEYLYLYTTLLCPLIEGEEYHFTAYLRFEEGKYAADGFGAALVPSLPEWDTISTFTRLQLQPQVNNSGGKKTSILFNDREWVEVSGRFTAQGGEQFLILGNFTPYDELKRRRVAKIRYPLPSYYFVDDVLLIQVSEDKEPCPEIMR